MQELDFDPDEERRVRPERETAREDWHFYRRARAAGRTEGQATFGDHSHTIGGNLNDLHGSTFNIMSASRDRAHAWIVADTFRLRVRQIFVPGRPAGPDASSLNRLIQGLGSSPGVHVITGPPGSGRFTLAVRALDAVASPQRIAVFTDGTDPAALVSEDLEADTAYILMLRPGDTSPGRAQTVVHQLESLAITSRCRIVLVAGHTFPAVPGTVTVTRNERPPALDVLTSHLRGFPEITPSEIPDLPQIAETMAGCQMAELADAAEHIATAVSQGMPADTFLRHIVMDRVTGLLRSPVREHDEARSLRDAHLLPLFRRSVLVAAAVFHGQPLDVVVEAATELTAMLRGKEFDGTPAVPPFADTTHELLDWLGAEQTFPAADVGGRPPHGDALRFRNPGTPEAVLETVWRDRHIAAPVLLGWLTDQAVNRRGAVRPSGRRLHAAMAMGRLASFDFDKIMDLVEERWIAPGTVSGRQALNWAADVVLADPRLTDPLWNRVRGWAGRAGISWRRAALTIYADAMGPEHVAEALRLVELVKREQFVDGTPLGYLIPAVLRRAAGVGAMVEVLAVLEKWLALIAWMRRQASRSRLTSTVDLQDGPPTQAGRTLILLTDPYGGVRDDYLAAVRGSARYTALHHELWRLLLQWPGTARAGLRRLQEWIEEAEHDPELEKDCADLLLFLLADPAVRSRLAFAGNRWVTTWGGTRPTSERLVRVAVRNAVPVDVRNTGAHPVGGSR